MNIIILGNGFDLAHDLQTKYIDLIEFCNNFQSSDIKFDDDNINNEFLHIISTNFWLSYFNKILKFIQESGNTWIDFENIIYDSLNIFTHRSNNSFIYTYETVNTNMLKYQQINEMTNRLQITLAEELYNLNYDYVERSGYTTKIQIKITNVEAICSKLYDELRNFTRILELYIFFIVDQNNNLDKYKYNFSKFKCKPVSEIKPVIYIINFNYTHFLEQFIHNYPIYPIFIYPHGKINNQDLFKPNKSNSTNLILGTKSFISRDRNNKIPLYLKIFQKHNQRHMYDTIDKYQELLKKSRNVKDEEIVIYVIGHSLNFSDHTILRNIFTINSNTYITIFYHNDESYKKYINNITQILGEDIVSSRVNFKHQHDIIDGFLLKKT
jgi:hypothetical protein